MSDLDNKLTASELTVTQNGKYNVEEYDLLTTNVPTGSVGIENNAEKMNSYLNEYRLDEAYVYTGNTTADYTQGWMYIVKESE